LRREIEDQEGAETFLFLLIITNIRRAEPVRTIPLIFFSAEDFWGDETQLDNSTNPIIVGTHAAVGGVNAKLDKEFTLPVDH